MLAHLESYIQKEASEHTIQHKMNVNDTVCKHFVTNLSQCSLHTVTGHYHPVPLVCTPGLKQLSGQPTLHHTWAGQDNTGTNVFKVLNVLTREKKVVDIYFF